MSWDLIRLTLNLEENYMKALCLTLIFLLSESVFSEELDTPSWVLGLRNGQEGVKLIAGNKIFYRRQVSNQSDDKEGTCNQAISAAEESLKKEIHYEIKIPYTLEIVFYDKKAQDCSVTISISAGLLSKLQEIDSLKKQEEKSRKEIEQKLKLARDENKKTQKDYDELLKIVTENKQLFQNIQFLNDSIATAQAIVKNRSARAKKFAFNGLRVNEFRKMINENVEINVDIDSLCYTKLKYIHSSNHAGVNVCWSSGSREAEIVSFCYGKGCYSLE